jgi:hypothetical protein
MHQRNISGWNCLTHGLSGGRKQPGRVLQAFSGGGLTGVHPAGPPKSP